MGASDCLTSGRLVIKDGSELGSTSYYKDAFLHAQFNIPYYAIIVLNELASARERGVAADIDEIIETLIRTELVAGSAQQKALADQARIDQENMEKWYYEQSLKSGQRDKDGKMKAFNFEGNRVQRVNETFEQRRALAEDWERKKIVTWSSCSFCDCGGGHSCHRWCSGYSQFCSIRRYFCSQFCSIRRYSNFKNCSRGTGWNIVTYGAKVYEKAKEYPNVAVLTGGLAIAGVKSVKDYMDHRQDYLKVLTVHQVLKRISCAWYIL